MLNEVVSLFDDSLGVQPAADRRLTKRFVDAWARAARGRFPSWRAMRSIDLGEDWNWSFAVDLAKSASFPYFIYLGSNLAKLSDVYLTGDADWTMTLLDKATDEIQACVAAEAPHEREDQLVLCNGQRILFRCVTAPLADNGRTITHVAGAASGVLAK